MRLEPLSVWKARRMRLSTSASRSASSPPGRSVAILPSTSSASDRKISSSSASTPAASLGIGADGAADDASAAAGIGSASATIRRSAAESLPASHACSCVVASVTWRRSAASSSMAAWSLTACRAARRRWISGESAPAATRMASIAAWRAAASAVAGTSSVRRGARASSSVASA
ncbi:hypothetical protein D3C81_738230 [compost metagenome]